MCEAVSPSGQESLPVLDELAGPLDAPAAPEPVAAGTVLAAPDGKSLRVQTLLKAKPDVNVYEAVAEADGQTVWLREAFTEAAVAQLRREAEAMEGLDCPMFPPVLMHFQNEGRAYLAADPTPGATLAESLTTGQLPLSRVISVLAQVASALTRLHARGWAYLGLVPSVVVLGKPVKIVDFTFLTRIGEKPATSFFHAGYTAPEVPAQEPAHPRADVYSVGALLFHAVNRQPMPETGAELSAWEPPTLVAGVPQVLDRCLLRPDTRYATMEDLHRDLLRLARQCAPTLSYTIGCATTIGLEPTRITNQDAYGYLQGRLDSEEGTNTWLVVCVADGMGGMSAGEVASQVAATTVMAEAATALATGVVPSPQDQVAMVKRWAEAANDKVCTALETRQARGGTTLLCVCVVNRRLTIAHVGDCRLYLVREGKATVLTRDHSLAMALALQGEIAVEQVRHHPDRNKVTRSLGERRPLPDYFVDTLEQITGSTTMELLVGDVVVLCTDGLWEPVLEEEMISALRDRGADLNAAAATLVGVALLRGAPDNATVVLLRLDEMIAQKEA